MTCQCALLIKTYNAPAGPNCPENAADVTPMKGTPKIQTRSFQSYFPKSIFLLKYISTKALMATTFTIRFWAVMNSTNIKAYSSQSSRGYTWFCEMTICKWSKLWAMLKVPSQMAMYTTKRSLLDHEKKDLLLRFLNDRISTVDAQIRLRKMDTRAGTCMTKNWPLSNP